MNIVLFEDGNQVKLYPLTLTRPSADLRVGILKLSEKWKHHFPEAKISYKLQRSYLQKKFKLALQKENLFINDRVLANQKLVEDIKNLNSNEALYASSTLIAYKSDDIQESFEDFKKIDCEANLINFPEDLFSLNATELQIDFDNLTKGRTSQTISKSNQTINLQNIFLEEGAKVECAILNASDGPIYVGKNAEIMEGSIVRGGLALCESAVLKLGAKIYGATTIGPHSKVGGEVNNSVILGYSNKGHDGFLGNSVLGEWCNLGADTNTSNLKNNYAEVKIWDYETNRFRATGKQFCGLIMGDHSKSGINTMFNTGTVVGICSNLFGSGFPRNFVPSFAWGGASGFTTYRTKKVLEVAEVVMSRRNIKLDQIEIDIIEAVYESSSNQRYWENVKK